MDARRRISDSIAHLLGRRHFYGYLLQGFDLVYEPRLPAAMGMRFAKEKGRIVLAYNPEWWIQPVELPWVWGAPTEPWTDAHLVAALEHECLHVVLKHLSRHPTGDRRLWNIAQDMVINQQLTGLPRGCVTLDHDGRTYPAGLHADGYYQLLQRHPPACPIHNPSRQEPGQSEEPGREGPGTPSGNGGDSPASPASTHGHGAGVPCPQCSGQTLDCHDGFANGPDAEADEAMRAAVGYANQRHKEEGAPGSGRGSLPADVERMIEVMLHRPVNWRHRLRRIGDSAIRFGRRNTIRRPHRRYGAQFSGRKPARSGKVVVAIDTSGSVSSTLLGAFWVEVLAMARQVGVVVVECDAAVHDAWLLRHRGVPRLKGGGGSSFQGVFDLVAGQGEHPRRWRSLVAGASALVFLTDGDIHVPESNPTELDVYWVVPRGAKAPTEAYGEVVEME